jgi:hypothetical protein
VVAILLAPAVFRVFGLVNGIASMQIACAGALGWLAIAGGGWSSIAAYASFTGFQWMSEPGMDTVLMSRVQAGERAGASALSLLIVSGSQAIAATLAGAGFARFGYPSTMAVVAVAILAAGCSFRLLLGREASQPCGEVEGACVAATPLRD